MPSKSGSSVTSLFQTANAQGNLSTASLQALSVPDVGVAIQNALGVSVDSVSASEVVLAGVMPDDSGSIRFAGNAQVVRDGHNMVIDALMGSKQKNSILFHTRYLNGLVLYPFGPLDQATRLDTHNYDPNLGTPLYDQSLVFLGTILAKWQEFQDNGVPARSVSLIVTDGHDEGSVRNTAKDVAAVIKDLLMTEMHIVAAMGIDDGGRTNFRAVFAEMGIEDKWILTPKNTPTEIRRAFGTFSQSAVRASQSAVSFSKTALGGLGGGFATP